MLTKYSVIHQINNMSLLNEIKRVNGVAETAVVTHFSMNCGGRTILIGADYNHAKRAEGSMHTVGCNGADLFNEGYSVSPDKESLIKYALEQLKNVLEALIPED